MGEAVDKLIVKLARVYVPPHVRVSAGKPVHVSGYWRTMESGQIGRVQMGGGETYGEGSRGPRRTMKFGADIGTSIDSMEYQGTNIKMHRAYQWTSGGGRIIHTGVFKGSMTAQHEPHFGEMEHYDTQTKTRTSDHPESWNTATYADKGSFMSLEEAARKFDHPEQRVAEQESRFWKKENARQRLGGQLRKIGEQQRSLMGPKKRRSLPRGFGSTSPLRFS